VGVSNLVRSYEVDIFQAWIMLLDLFAANAASGEWNLKGLVAPSGIGGAGPGYETNEWTMFRHTVSSRMNSTAPMTIDEGEEDDDDKDGDGDDGRHGEGGGHGGQDEDHDEGGDVKICETLTLGRSGRASGSSGARERKAASGDGAASPPEEFLSPENEALAKASDGGNESGGDPEPSTVSVAAPQSAGAQSPDTRRGELLSLFPPDLMAQMECRCNMVKCDGCGEFPSLARRYTRVWQVPHLQPG